ncbi:dual specificity protein phosphatase family protein [uncultured Brevundimonas sp.]|uniref:dual specificity protein phosphatase family protein n=1 Tax=uncultured Brevundimonas sp. TaxID=213418 RepID=UPI002613B3A5|nr:dual specificity protein phosphatase family protein [uncultured Brevundimonas sp.]
MTMPKASGRKVAVRSIVGVAVAGVVFTLGYLQGLQISGNFHPVVEGKAYRSAQPMGDDLDRYQKAYGIKTVINLRGPNEGAKWYDEEIKTSERLGLTHIDFRMSANRELSSEEAKALVKVLEGAEQPVLIHCKAGSDRSGLASALYVAAVERGGEEAAERQISIKYGHISLPLSSTFAMDRTFEFLEPWLGYHDS